MNLGGIPRNRNPFRLGISGNPGGPASTQSANGTTRTLRLIVV